MSRKMVKQSAKPSEWDKANTSYIRTDRFTTIYTNNIQIGFTNWDMWMELGEIVGQENNQLIVENRARVVMSLQHAKAFLEALQTGVTGFEKHFGPIQKLQPIEQAKGEKK